MELDIRKVAQGLIDKLDLAITEAKQKASGVELLYNALVEEINRGNETKQHSESAVQESTPDQADSQVLPNS